MPRHEQLDSSPSATILLCLFLSWKYLKIPCTKPYTYLPGSLMPKHPTWVPSEKPTRNLSFCSLVPSWSNTFAYNVLWTLTMVPVPPQPLQIKRNICKQMKENTSYKNYSIILYSCHNYNSSIYKIYHMVVCPMLCSILLLGLTQMVVK
jgi:hypothetical protein